MTGEIHSGSSMSEMSSPLPEKLKCVTDHAAHTPKTVLSGTTARATSSVSRMAVRLCGAISAPK